MIALILIRGPVRVPTVILDTLQMLNLTRTNTCVLLDEPSDSVKGMIKKVESFITWGEVDKEVEELLKAKLKGKKIHLSPPRKGFGRKGVKASFKVGGALGYRGDKINDLIRRML